MKDTQNRESGKYVETFEIEQDGVTYTVTETTVIGRDSMIINFARAYNPPIPYKSTRHF